jgi:hypothetical protein
LTWQAGEIWTSHRAPDVAAAGGEFADAAAVIDGQMV